MHFGHIFGLDIYVPVWLLLIIGLLVAYYIYTTWKFDTFKKMDIQGPAPIPVFGNIRQMMEKDIKGFELENVKKYGKIYGWFLGRTPCLSVADTDILKQVLVKEFPNFMNRTTSHFNQKQALMSLAMFNLHDDHWRHVRNSLSPTFSANKLKLMQQQILKCADQLVDHLRKTAAKEEDGFDLKQLTDAFSMDVIAYTTYGIELDSFADPDNIFVRINKKILNISLGDWKFLIIFLFPFMRKFLGWLFPLINVDDDNFFIQITRKVLDDRKQGVSKKQKDFIQLMADSLVDEPTEKDMSQPNIAKDDLDVIWNNKGLTEREIAANALIYILAGYENNSATMSYVAYCLALNPDVQERLLDEIDTKLNGKAPRYEDVSELTYLQQVIDETLRLYPLAPRIDRSVKNDITLNGIQFKKGMQVGIPVITLQMDPDIWPDPERFDPDRFTEEAKAERDPYYYMPFGMGPRNCIGLRLALLEIKIALVRVLQNFKFRTCSKTEVPLQFKKMRVTPVNGVFLCAESR